MNKIAEGDKNFRIFGQNVEPMSTRKSSWAPAIGEEFVSRA